MVMSSLPSRLPTQVRKTEIIAAVLQLAAQGSPDGITTSEIARVLNLSQGAVFKHFPTKEAIWLAVLEWVEAELFARLDQAVQGGATPLASLCAVFRAHVLFVMTHPGVASLIFQDVPRSEDSLLKARARGLLGRFRKLLADLIEAAEKQGEIAPGLDRTAAAKLFMGVLHGLVIQAMLDGGTARMEAEAGRVLPLYLQAIQVHS